jgi:hypothetical protein
VILVASHGDYAWCLAEDVLLDTLTGYDPDVAETCVGSYPACAHSHALHTLAILQLIVPVADSSWLLVLIERLEEDVAVLLASHLGFLIINVHLILQVVILFVLVQVLLLSFVGNSQTRVVHDSHSHVVVIVEDQTSMEVLVCEVHINGSELELLPLHDYAY